MNFAYRINIAESSNIARICHVVKSWKLEKSYRLRRLANSSHQYRYTDDVEFLKCGDLFKTFPVRVYDNYS